MDPQACLNELLRLTLSADSKAHEQAAEHVRNLIRWYERGGFCPDLATAFNVVLRRRREMQS